MRVHLICAFTFRPYGNPTFSQRQSSKRPNLPGIGFSARGCSFGFASIPHQHPNLVGQNGARRSESLSQCRSQRFGRNSDGRKHHPCSRSHSRARNASGTDGGINQKRQPHSTTANHTLYNSSGEKIHKILRLFRRSTRPFSSSYLSSHLNNFFEKMSTSAPAHSLDRKMPVRKHVQDVVLQRLLFQKHSNEVNPLSLRPHS